MDSNENYIDFMIMKEEELSNLWIIASYIRSKVCKSEKINVYVNYENVESGENFNLKMRMKDLVRFLFEYRIIF